MNKIATTAKKFVAANKVGIAVTVTVAVCFAINRRAIKQHNDFLKENGLFDQFYDMED